MGIATGEVVQGNIGFAGKLEYTVIGPAVNKAFRLVSAADPATVLLDDPTVAASKAVTIVDGVTLKGVGPVKVYQLTETLLPDRCCSLNPKVMNDEPSTCLLIITSILLS